jgi:hypothetical protein
VPDEEKPASELSAVREQEDSVAVNQSKSCVQEDEVPCLDSSDESMLSSTSKRNRDIYGMLGDDVENQTDMMCEE